MVWRMFWKPSPDSRAFRNASARDFFCSSVRMLSCFSWAAFNLGPNSFLISSIEAFCASVRSRSRTM